MQVVMSLEMRDVLQHRAETNRRSLSHETLYLIETALALKNEAMRDALQVLFQACHPEPRPLEA